MSGTELAEIRSALSGQDEVLLRLKVTLKSILREAHCTFEWVSDVFRSLKDHLDLKFIDLFEIELSKRGVNL